MTDMTDMIYITNMTVIFLQDYCNYFFLEIYNPKYAIMLCEKVFVQSIECD